VCVCVFVCVDAHSVQGTLISRTRLYGAEMWTLREYIRNNWKVLNEVLEKDEEDQLRQSCEIYNITYSQRDKEYPT